MNIDVYVDGSYNDKLKRYGGGVCVLRPDGGTKLHSCGESNPAFVSQRNIAGEILAAINGIIMALEYNPSSITVYHDYEGLGKWARGEYKAGNQLSKAYVEFVRSQKIPIYFMQVPAHSGNFYNDEADKLAKIGAGIEVD